MMSLVLVLLCTALAIHFASAPYVYFAELKARAYIFKAEPSVENPYHIIGVLDFIQDGQLLRVNGSVSCLSAGPHGFHVHQNGDIGDACKDAGPHYNPFGNDHGGPFCLPRHNGDLGNIIASDSGIATINEVFAGTSLLPSYSIIGRAIVVHAMRDDLGFGNAPTSRTTGDSGMRVACGIIGIK